ncbi:fatty acid desaturase [Micromonospora qiuiae]|uniref:Fatty acid desaturase n=1 Tax=Micromonospora qiuiae TaxID=502268 RepID=A0ABQ4JG23_9ACTN|nr:fatty acid desaturase [Micromonospora qiuiae]GIJ29226.1 fatty acid desaturase [Micromonospora qiuiae]
MTTREQSLEPDRALIASLARADRWRVAVRTLVILGAYAGTVVLALQPAVGWWALLCSVFLAFVLTGFLNAVHDCVHRAHLRSKLGNRIAGAAWGTPITMNFTIYRHEHLVHHRFTGVEGDTEKPQHFESAGSYLHAMSGVSYWPVLAAFIAKTSLGELPENLNTPERRRDARIDNWVVVGWLALMVTLTVFFPVALLVAYWLPLFLVMPAAMIMAVPEHYGLWGTPDVMRNTRTVRSNGFVRYFIWNGNYHAEHHRYPAVASVNLHRLHKALPQPHPVQVRSYVGFHLGLLRALLRGDKDYGKVPADDTATPAGQG